MNPASAITSLDQVPALHKKILAIHKSAIVFDFGAGVSGAVDAFMAEKGNPYFPYDPFNRDFLTNLGSIAEVSNCTFVLCANVLNVVEDEYLDSVISRLSSLAEKTKEKRVFLSVYHNKALPINRKVRGHFQRNQPLSWYIPHLEKHFQRVTKMNTILCCSIKDFS